MNEAVAGGCGADLTYDGSKRSSEPLSSEQKQASDAQCQRDTEPAWQQWHPLPAAVCGGTHARVFRILEVERRRSRQCTASSRGSNRESVPVEFRWSSAAASGGCSLISG